jgi:membrane protein implicated in regulation of membrane protease activity
MDQLLLNLKQNPNGWYDLSGDVYLLGEGMTQGVGMDVRGGAVRVVPLQPSLAVWLARLRPYLFGVAFVALLALLIWLYPKLVRKQPTSA